jgi:hypothetical protein
MVENALPAARHEPRDVGGTFIWMGASLVLATVIALALLVLWLFPNAIADRTMSLPLPPYPNPQLQPSPRDDMARSYREEMQWLNGTGWVDKAHGIVHIPIADAMRQVAQTGIPDWPTSTPSKQP